MDDNKLLQGLIDRIERQPPHIPKPLRDPMSFLIGLCFGVAIGVGAMLSIFTEAILR